MKMLELVDELRAKLAEAERKGIAAMNDRELFRERLSEAEKDRERLELVISNTLADFESLERSYGGSLWSTGAGYVLRPRFLEMQGVFAARAQAKEQG